MGKSGLAVRFGGHVCSGMINALLLGVAIREPDAGVWAAFEGFKIDAK
jgi:hypothetical protein